MPNIAEITAILEDLQDLAPAGFALALHMGMMSPAFMFQTYPKEWVEIYTQKMLIASDPTVAWALSNTGSIRWSELTDQDPEKVLEQSEAYGLVFGAAVAVDAKGTRSLFGMSRTDREFSDTELATLHDYAKKLHGLTSLPASRSAKLRDELQSLSIQMTRHV